MPVTITHKKDLNIDTEQNVKDKSIKLAILLVSVFILVSLLNTIFIYTATKDFKTSFYNYKLTLGVPAAIFLILLISLLFMRQHHRIVSFKFLAIVLAFLFAGISAGSWILFEPELRNNYNMYTSSIVTAIIGVVGYFFIHNMTYTKTYAKTWNIEI